MKSKNIDQKKQKPYKDAMSKNIQDYLPPRKTDAIAFTARVPEKLLVDVKTICKRQHLTFTEVIQACLSKFVDEMGKSA